LTCHRSLHILRWPRHLLRKSHLLKLILIMSIDFFIITFGFVRTLRVVSSQVAFALRVKFWGGHLLLLSFRRGVLLCELLLLSNLLNDGLLFLLFLFDFTLLFEDSFKI
jgi:hypothetical protein